MVRVSVGGGALRQVTQGARCPDCAERTGNHGPVIFLCGECGTTWTPDLELAEVEAWWIASGLVAKLGKGAK